MGTGTITPQSVVTTAQSDAVNGLLTSIFQALVNLLFSVVDLFVTFFSQPAVLGALAVISIVVYAYNRFKNKVGI